MSILKAGVVVVAMTAMGLVLSPAAAQAATVGTATVTPATGTPDATRASVEASAACPAGATNVITRIFGSGFPAAGEIIAPNQPIGNLSTNGAGGVVVPVSDVFRTFANLQSPPAVLNGKYDITISCINNFGTSNFGDYTGSIWFVNNTAYQSTDPAGTATTTTLTTNPVSPVTTGTNVTLTATVAPAAATGSVQFKDGATVLGTGTVSGGVATFSTAGLGQGTHSLTAVYTPDSGTYKTSTSSAVSFVVNKGAAIGTTTSLVVSPANTAAEHSNVALTATVTPSNAVGSVQFKDGATTLGTVPVSGGAAALTISTLALGAHSLVASFVPTDATDFTSSASAAVDYQVTPFTGASTAETITTTVDAGALVISVDDSQVVLANPTLNSAGDLFVTSGALKPVTVTDTRAGNFGWTVSGQVSDFVSGGNSINGANLGWVPSVVDHATAQTVTAGGSVAAGNGVAPGVASAAGLKVSRTLAVGTGLGTSHLGAALTLNAPTSTLAGTYTATLTLTVI
ncbi:Ig-like domain-containing protein [Hamadaea tsunoensis]|uniref:Ig-like domain-containing protein n=1 Tax=Hamadaea tsunoensis TaxID=53368 RepID=UPI001FE200F9|nr:Ig-like domain-containing protein [Hamadaea tsunoensis]